MKIKVEIVIDVNPDRWRANNNGPLPTLADVRADIRSYIDNALRNGLPLLTNECEGTVTIRTTAAPKMAAPRPQRERRESRPLAR